MVFQLDLSSLRLLIYFFFFFSKGTLSTMRHIKKDITEARKGTECGLGFGEFRDLEAGDLIQMYEKIEKPGIL